MFRFINIYKLFHSPDDGNGILNRGSIFDALNDDNDDGGKENLLADDKSEDTEVDDEDKGPEKDKKETKKDKEDNEEVDELDELEDELLPEEDDKDDKDGDELEQELIAPVSRKKILKEFPELFKKFPHIERALYKSKEYSELFPTLDDAREIKNKAETLDVFEQDLGSGDISKVLTATKQSNPNAFNKLVDNLFPVLSSVDEKAATTLSGNLISHTIYAMATEGRKNKDPKLVEAAALLNKFVFGETDYVAPKKLATEETVDPEKQKLEKDRQEFLQTRFQVSNKEVSNRVTNALRNTIDENIDPKGVMEDYVKRNASRDAFELVNKLLVSDKRFRSIVDKLWERAAATNFSPESVDAVRRAFLSRGKQLLPTAINKARTEALKGMRKRSDNSNNGDDELADIKVDKTKHSESRRSSSKPQIHDSKAPKPGESTLDFLMRD